MIVCDSLYQVGFEMIDSISQAQGILMNTIQSKALIGIGGSSAIFLFIWVIFFSIQGGCGIYSEFFV